MNTHPAQLLRRIERDVACGVRLVPAVLALAALAIPARSLAQTPTFNALVSTYTNVGSGFPDNATVGDVNGDGKLDAIVTGGDNPSIMHVMLGNGDGTFTDHGVQLPQVTTSNVSNLPASLTGFLPVSVGSFGQVQAIDVNHDGKLDLVTIESIGINFVNYSFIGVLINTGNDASGVPQFTATHFYVPFLGARTLTLGDLNGDGAPDLTLGFGGGAFYIWLNNGSGGFSPGQVYPLTPGAGGPAVGQAVIADLNGDGKADYVVTSNQNGGANVFFGNGDGTLQAPIYLPNSAVSVAVADVNGDGKPDLLMGGSLTSSAGSEGLMVYLNNGGGSFGAPTLFAVPSVNGGLAGGGSVALADLNGDGILDAVVSNLSNNTVAVLLGDGHGGYGAPIAFSASFAPTWVFVGDFNGDGKPDIGVDLRNSRNFGVLTNTTVSAPPPTAPVTVSAPSLVVPGDITVNATSAAGAVVTFGASATSNVSMELFRRDTQIGETWKAYSTTFTSGRTGTFTFGFNLTAPTSGINGSILVDHVKLASGASTLFEDGFEISGIPNPPRGVSANGGTATFGNWVFNNYSGILQGPDPQDWGLPAINAPTGLGSADGTWEFAYLQQYNGSLGNMHAVSAISVVAGHAYTLSFYQASRLYFGAPNTYTVTLTNTESVPVVASPLASGATFPIGTTTVTLTATNSAGGVTTGTFKVIVKGTPPVISAVSPITIEATSAAGASPAASSLGTAVDSYGASVPVTASPVGPYALGITGVTLSATDAMGLTTTKQILVNVVDTTPPTLTVPANKVVEATSAAGAPVTFAATATDAVTANPTITYSVASGSTFAIGTTTVNVTAKDAANNSRSGSFTITVRDTTAPVVTATMTARGGGDDESSQFFTIAFSATDAVGVKTLTGTLNGVTVTNGQVVQLQTIKSGAQSVKRDDGKLQIKATSFKLTVIATDAAGNSSTSTVVPVFVKNGKDSEDKGSQGNGQSNNGNDQSDDKKGDH